MTALRTLRSSNGLIVVFIEIQRPPPDGISTSWLLRFCDASLRFSGSGEKSPLIMLWPVRMRREATPGSSLPSRLSISSRYAGLKSSDLSQLGLRTRWMRLPGS